MAKGDPLHDDQPSLIHHSVCGSDCVSSFNVDSDIRSDIPHEASWPECFPLKSTVELVTKWGLDPGSIVTRLANPLGGRLFHNMDSLRIIGANRVQAYFPQEATCAKESSGSSYCLRVCSCST